MSLHPEIPSQHPSNLPGIAGHPELDVLDAAENIRRAAANGTRRHSKRHLLPEIAPSEPIDTGWGAALKQAVRNLLGRGVSAS